MAKLISSVTVTPAQVQPGQSVHVQVIGPNGKPYEAGTDVVIAIDGVPVASRYYQFPTVGKRTVTVRATLGATTETAVATIDVTGAPMMYRRFIAEPGVPQAPGTIPILVTDQQLGHPYQVTFSLVMPPIARAAAARKLIEADKAHEGKQPPVVKPAVSKPPARFLELQALFQKAPPGTVTAKTHAPLKIGEATLKHATLHMVLPHQLPVPHPHPAPGAKTSYIWNFGDGKTATTASPTVTHDYFGSIKPGQVSFPFDVSCKIVHDNITVTRTLVLYSAYGMCQRKNMTVPHVEGDSFASLSHDGSSFSASLLVYNIEAHPMTINKMAVVPVLLDPGATLPQAALKPMQHPVTIGANASSLLAVHVSKQELSQAAGGAPVSGFIIQFEGTLSSPAVRPRPKGFTLLNRLNPVSSGPAAVAGTQTAVRFSRHIRLHMQDRELPRPPGVILKFPKIPLVLGAFTKLGNGTHPLVHPGGMAVDPATNVVSVALTAARPTPFEVANVRHAVLSILKNVNLKGTKP